MSPSDIAAQVLGRQNDCSQKPTGREMAPVCKSNRFVFPVWVSADDMKLSGGNLSCPALNFLRYVNSFGG